MVVDADFADAGVASCAYWFHGCGSLVEVSGFEHLAGASDFTQCFASCASLESIYAASWAPVTAPTGALAFSGCGRLVGGAGFVPSSTTGASALSLSVDGVLTDPAADERA